MQMPTPDDDLPGEPFNDIGMLRREVCGFRAIRGEAVKLRLGGVEVRAFGRGDFGDGEQGWREIKCCEDAYPSSISTS
ncbi:MAG: hypothetical protein WKF77_11995 [Planctomycetaceae bacterium]